jgi:isopentenyl-diphosphate delta-isomerase
MSDTEQAVIVDTDDNVLEYRNRDQVGTFDLHRIVAVWIVNADGRVLLAQRAHTMTNQPGVWGPAAAGTVTAGEDYIITAQRELAEEIGLSEVKLRQVGKFVTDRDFGECRMCAVFVGAYDGNIDNLQLQPEEVAAVRWMSVKELRAELTNHPQNFVINMQQVIDCL